MEATEAVMNLTRLSVELEGELMDNIGGIIRARRAAATALRSALIALAKCNEHYTEAELASQWLAAVRMRGDILPFGWYQPPPNGISVLIGNPPTFDRLEYTSLRDPRNWPSESAKTTAESVLYPYLSAVDRETGMLGDFVGTFYAGRRPEVRDWIREVYLATMRIAEFTQVGQRLSEVFEYAESVMKSLGSRNNTFSLSSGTPLGADIGHTIPGYGDSSQPWMRKGVSEAEIAVEIARGRTFVNASNNARIDGATAFTIEPQMLLPGLPMASFHVIVAFARNEKLLITEFDDLFAMFEMDRWIRCSGRR
jgi:hypothetical protein